MKRSISSGYFVFVFGILFCLFSIGLCYAQEKYTMRFSHGLPENHFIANQYKEWANLINERSKGVLKVEIYPSAQLFKDLEVIRAIQMGTIESGGSYSFNIGRSVAEFNILDVPFLFHTTEEMLKVAKSEVGALLVRAAEKQGIKVLAWFPYPQEGEGILSKNPLKVPSDCKGLIARATGPPSAQLIKLWGGGASSLSGAEVYMGLQRGTLGATFSTIETSVERKIYEVAPYSVIIPWGAVFAMPLMNAEYFNKLPKELQEIVVDAALEVEKKTVQRALEINASAKRVLEEKGYPPYIPTKEENALWEKDTQPIKDSAMEASPGGKELLKKIDSILKR
jgi:C4-dicarboxylate-binding protein DctP